METIGFLIFFGVMIAHLCSVPMDNISYVGTCIGIGLCCIAQAIRSRRGK